MLHYPCQLLHIPRGLHLLHDFSQKFHWQGVAGVHLSWGMAACVCQFACACVGHPCVCPPPPPFVCNCQVRRYVSGVGAGLQLTSSPLFTSRALSSPGSRSSPPPCLLYLVLLLFFDGTALYFPFILSYVTIFSRSSSSPSGSHPLLSVPFYSHHSLFIT